MAADSPPCSPRAEAPNAMRPPSTANATSDPKPGIARALGPAPNPRADRPLIEAVHAWLDVRRPLTCELYVIGCEYVPLALTVGVEIRDVRLIEKTGGRADWRA